MTVVALGLGCVDGRRGVASQGVLPRSNWTKVVGVDAGPVVTPEVVKLKPFGNQTVDSFVVEGCCLDGSPGTGNMSQAVPVIVQVFQPDPTSGSWINSVVGSALVVAVDEAQRFSSDPSPATMCLSSQRGTTTASTFTESICHANDHSTTGNVPC